MGICIVRTGGRLSTCADACRRGRADQRGPASSRGTRCRHRLLLSDLMTNQRSRGFTGSGTIHLCQFESAVAWSASVAFQRKRPAAIGVKAPLPGFIEPALATSIETVPSGTRWIQYLLPWINPRRAFSDWFLLHSLSPRLFKEGAIPHGTEGAVFHGARQAWLSAGTRHSHIFRRTSR